MSVLTVNLEKELHNIRKKENLKIEKEQNLIINEANSILEKAQEEDLTILKSIGLYENVRKAEIYRNKKLENVYSYEELKTLCIKYGLRYMHLSYYSGSVDPYLPEKLKEFKAKMKESGKIINFNDNNWYIMAPKESFKLEERPVDPLLFYEYGKDNYLVHKWGNDLSIFRQVAYFPIRNWASYVMTNVMISLLAAIFIVCSLSILKIFLITLAGIGILFVANLFFGLFRVMLDYDEFISFQEDNWNSKYLN